MNLRSPCIHERYEAHYSYLDPSTWCPGGTDIASIAEVTPFLADIGYAGVINITDVLEAMSQPFDGDKKAEVYVVGRVEGPALTNDFAGSFVLIAMDRAPQEVG